MKKRGKTYSSDVVEAKCLFTKQRYHIVTHDSGGGFSCSIVEIRYRFTKIEAVYTHVKQNVHPYLCKKR